MVSKSLYLKRDGDGLCVRCGEARGESTTKQCQKCISSAKIKRDDKRIKRVNKKLCILCGMSQISVLDKYCADCHSKKKEIDKKSYQGKVIINICIKCNKPSKTSYCKECSTKQLQKLLEKGGIKQIVFGLYGTNCKTCKENNAKNLLLVPKNPLSKLDQQTKDFFQSIYNKTAHAVPASPPSEYILMCQNCLRNRSIKTVSQKTNLLNNQTQNEHLLLENQDDLDD